ncbi:hypothetical protein WMY93_007227 [Mugilogobius chulae]|uniref:Ribosomal RNA-processing protein 12-like conserved domain-containing protein n=1 Tax=Mugilogobius chulae TaxID=88201 RepID=A0AAW0PMK7_9GOBI
MVKSGKLRSGTGSKLKRWKKGHSSDSNPQTSRFRQAAKSRFFSRPTGKSDLTVDALKLHNELQTGPLEVKERKDACSMEEEPEETLSDRTSGTFLSGLSDCSNLTFRKVQRYWESNSAAHKEICAVLAAVTEVIRSQGGKETETEYFAALMTTLEVVDSAESQTAVAYLLNLVMKRVPAPVLITKFSDTSKALMDVMSKQATSDSASALRWILSCLATLLRKQEASVWTYPSTLQIYHGLLSFTVHSKPKVRKAAQQGVCSILRGSDFLFKDDAPAYHPVATTTAKFCIKEMEQAGGSKEDTTTLHVLGLLKELLGTFPLGAVKSCCETLLRVMTLSHVLVTASAMQAFHKLFSSKPKASTLSPELNAQIITALYDYLPSENDLQPLLAWLAVMEKAHVHLANLQSSLSLGHLPRLFSAAVSCLLSPHSQVVSAATSTLKVYLLNECVAPHMEEISLITTTSSAGNSSYICKMFKIVEEGPFYHDQVASVTGRSSLHSSLFFTGELDLAVGAAIEAMGPQIVLGAVPLNITGHDDDLEFPRSWLIPVIRDHVKNTQLGFFNSYFLPLASTLKHRDLDHAPWFLHWLLDLLASFKGIARTLGTAINEQPDLRLTVCQALRTVINKSCPTGTDAMQTSVNLCPVFLPTVFAGLFCRCRKGRSGKVLKNFLPILFNVYSQQPPAGESGTYRMAVLDTIKVYLTVTDKQMICTFLAKATERLSGTDNTEFTRLSMMDLIVAMAPLVDEATMTKTFEFIKPSLEIKEPGMQKKAYRVLEELCGGESEECKSFVVKNLETLKGSLLETLKNASSPAKRPRLKCLHHIVKRLGEEHKDFITALLPEVIICTKEAFMRFCGNPKDAMDQYLVLVYAGLTGSVTMITCTVLALTRLVFEYKDSIEVCTMEQLLHNICLLLTSRTREIVKAALGFIKVILFVMDPKTLASHVTVMMEGIGNIKDDVRRHFRTKLKNIFTRFIRKFGFELVKSMLPAEHHKVLANIRKAEARSKRKRQVAEQDDDDSDEEEETPKNKVESIEDILAESDSDMSEDESKPKKTQKKAGKPKAKAWLKEGEDDDPLNFLDPKVSQRVLATNPELKKSTKKEHGFKVTSDGRLIIRDDEEDDVKEKDGEMDDILEEAGVKSKKAQKRRFKDDGFDDEMDIEPELKYKAGGSGIHRQLGKDTGAEYKSKKGKGDIKQKGKLDPYAYIPLKKAQLNRRKRAKLQGQFKGMVRGAQKGALSGKKMQKKKRKG